MTDQRRDRGDLPADVHSIACARWEAAMLEGRADTWAREHERTCPRCGAMSGAHARLGELIAQATVPAALPSGFEERVLARAEALDAETEAPGPLLAETGSAARPRSAQRAWTLWLGAAAMAAGMGLAFWAGGLRERFQVSPEVAASAARPAAVPVGEAPAPAAVPATLAEAPPRSVAQPTRLLPLPAPRPAGEALAPVEAPVVPSARPVPEPAMDLPGELRSLLVREVSALEGCPARAQAPVRVTVTVGTDGTLSNRQILSSADASAAHQCVGRAMDRLLLPPLDQAATVTLDVSW